MILISIDILVTLFGQNVIIFSADMSSSIHTNFTVIKKKFCLSLHYNGASSYLFVNGTEIINFKANNSEIVATPTCLGNISKDWSVESMKRTWFNGCVYDFSVDYGAIAVDDILDIHKFFWKRITWYKNTWVYWKSVFYRINNFINL